MEENNKIRNLVTKPKKKKMKKVLQYALTFAVVAIVICWQTGYNPFAGSGEKGAVILTDQLKDLKKQTSSDEKRVAVVGKIVVSNSNLTLKIGSPTSMPVEDKDNNLIDHFEIYHGTGKNEFNLPVQFTPKDLKVYDNDGNAHSYDEDVQISFTMKRIKEAQPEKDPNTGEFVWRYEQIRIDPIK